MKNETKIQIFLAIAQKLNLKLGSTPILYGSLGLSESILATYQASSKDGYRKHKHLKDDGAKIRLIEEHLQGKIPKSNLQ